MAVSKNSELRNKWLYVAIAMVLGIVLIGWGWDKNESTIPARTHGAVLMIVTGVILFIGAFIALAAGTKGKSS